MSSTSFFPHQARGQIDTLRLTVAGVGCSRSDVMQAQLGALQEASTQGSSQSAALQKQV
jgi:hypothetical protein